MTYTSIQEQYLNIQQQLPENVQLVAVSKTHPAESIQEIYQMGQRIFGENKVQELTEKYPVLPKDIQWHLIGHLQTNKVKYIAEFIDTIESVDSDKLLKEIDKQAEKHQRKIKVFLQIKIAKEDSKFGLEKGEAEQLYDAYLNGEYPYVEITGLMGMATFTDQQQQIESEFKTLKTIFDEFTQKAPLKTLSMGMSDDFKLAIQCGSNCVRVGSAIFGRRNYQQP